MQGDSTGQPARTPRELAKLLWTQHQDRTRFESIAGLLPSGHVADAYSVQEELVQLMMPAEGAPMGYKIGLTSVVMRRMCGLDQPVAGVILERRVHRGPARIAARDFVRLGVESELCLVIGQDLPPQLSPCTLEEAARAVGGVAAAFELVDDREADYARLDAASLIADNSWNAGVVLGEVATLGTGSQLGTGSSPGTDSPLPAGSTSIDIAALDGVLRVDGQVAGRGNSADALTHPFAIVQWLSEHLRSRRSHLRAGDLVMTGSVVATRFAKNGEHYHFELTGLPPAELWVS
jgi:2-keto-4-pentenoate hydratase